MGYLRLLLAISVVIAHSNAIFGCNLLGGPLAVETFYIISGFYMSLILNEKYVDQNNSYRLFISNRFLRIYPIYWIILLLTIGLGLYINGGRLEPFATYYSNMSPGSLVFLVGTNIFIFFQDTVLFLGLNINTGNLFFTQHFEATNPQLHHFLLVPQAWTLGIEMSFYLIAPFLVRRSIRVIIPVILLSLLIKVFLYRAGLNFDPWNYRFFPAELQFFLLGNISYVLYRKIRTLKINQWLLYLFFFFILGFTVFFDFIPLHKKNALYLVSFFVALPFIFYMSKNNKYDTYIGELSYPVYISHLFVLQLLTILKVVKIPNFGLILTISSIAFSILLNEFVSKKIEVLRQRRIKKNSVLPSLVNLK